MQENKRSIFFLVGLSGLHRVPLCCQQLRLKGSAHGVTTLSHLWYTELAVKLGCYLVVEPPGTGVNKMLSSFLWWHSTAQ